MNISFRLNNSGVEDTSEKQIYVRLRGKNKSGKLEECTIGTKVFVPDKYFINGSLLTNCPSYTTKNRIINSIYADIEYVKSIIVEEKSIPYPRIVKKRYLQYIQNRAYVSPKVVSFWSAFDEFVDIRKHRTKGYLKTLTTLRNRLEDFEKWKGIKITFDHLSLSSNTFQYDLQDYLWTERKLSNSYVNKLLSNLSHILYYCDKQGYISNRPKFSYNSDVDRDEKIYLYRDEVIKLYKSNKFNYSVNKLFTNPHIYIISEVLEGTKAKNFGGIRCYTNWELVKDMFLFLCSIGCRYSDLPQFKVRHFNFDKKNSAFSWIQQKTNKRVYVPKNDISGYVFSKYSAGKSLTQYLFPKLSIQKFNKALKLLLKDLNFNRIVTYPKKVGSKVIDTDERFLWELISSHSGRRTFIKGMIDMNTMDYQTIMSMSGHRTISQFQKYISVSPHDLTKGEKLFQLNDTQKSSDVEELIKRFIELSEESQKSILQLIKNMS